MVKTVSKPLVFGFETSNVHNESSTERSRKSNNKNLLKSYLPIYGQYTAIKDLQNLSKLPDEVKEKINYKRRVARDIGSLFFANVFIYPIVDGIVTLKREIVQLYEDHKVKKTKHG